ncbi:hypothetical protein JXL19_03415 [bacterium]|nr:hypothetical protein [bacterium]
MRKAIALAVIIICFSLLITKTSFSQTNPEPRRWSGNINLFLGAKFLDDGDWEPVDKHLERGILFDIRHRRFPLSLAVDFFYSEDDEDIGVDILNYGPIYSYVESQTIELNLGIRKIWDKPKHVRPVIGGGLAIVNAETEAMALGASVSDENTGIGIWIEAGLYYTLAYQKNQFNIGFDARWSKAKVNLFDIEGNAGGWHIGTLLGYHW